MRAWQRASAVERERDGLLRDAESALAAAEGLTGDALLRQLDRASSAASRVLDTAPADPRATAVFEGAKAFRERGLKEREAASRRRILLRVGVGVLALGAGAGFFVAKAIDAKRVEAENAEVAMRAERDRADTERRRADAEAADAKVQSAHAVAQRAIADSQRRIAEAAQQKAVDAEAAAKANLERAEKVLNFLVFQVRDALQPLGRLDTLESVASKALEYFDQMPPEALTGESLRQKSVALDILGDVQDDRGDHEGALATFRRALEIAKKMSADAPQNVRLRHDVTVDLLKIGAALHSLDREDEALASFDEALAILRELVEKHPDDPDTATHRHALATTLSNRASSLEAKHDLEGAGTALEEALATARRLADREPKVLKWKALVGGMLDARASLERERGNLDVATTTYEAAVAKREEVLEADTTDVGARHSYGITQGNYGEVLEQLGRLDDAQAAYEAWLKAADRVVETDESNVAWVRSLIFAHEHLARVLEAKKLPAEAVPHRRVAYAVWKVFLGQSPKDLARERGTDAACDALDAALLAAGDTEGALAIEKESLELTERIAAREPTDSQRARNVSVVHNRMGRTLRLLSRPDEAAVAHRASLAIIAPLAKAHPDETGFAADVAYTQWRLGEALRDVPARAAEGTRLLETALATLRRLKDADALDESTALWIDEIDAILAPPSPPAGTQLPPKGPTPPK